MKKTRETPPEKEREHQFTEAVRAKEERKLKARRNRKSSLWFGFGMFGMVGWSVAIPALIGTALGVWLDARYAGSISWTLTGLLAGIVVGCFIAWLWVTRESQYE